jgi:hypothetical protein
MIDDLVSSRYPPMDVEVETVMIEDKTTSPLVSIGVIAVAGLTATILPIYLVRRWTKL